MTAIRRDVVGLCGGRSARMERDKASLPFGPETLRLFARLGDGAAVVPEAEGALQPLRAVYGPDTSADYAAPLRRAGL